MNQTSLRLRLFLYNFLLIMLTGTIGFMIIEDLSLTDALYFNIVTFATVGYGDIYPATQTGKVFAVLLILTGVGTFLGVIANATEMMLNRREKVVRFNKINMIVGVFFSELGTTLLTILSDSDPELDAIRKDLIINATWSNHDFSVVSNELKKYKYQIEYEKLDTGSLKKLLVDKRNFLVSLLENPILLEHETFTMVLLPIFHLTEELAVRDDLLHLPKNDKNHLRGDANRVYSLLALQWLDYMQHLKVHYPYLFSQPMRRNPFDLQAKPTIQ